MTLPLRRRSMLVVRGPGYPPAGPAGTPLVHVPLKVMKKYASSKPLFRPKQPRGWKDESPPEST
jgi:hypothetical protein